MILLVCLLMMALSVHSIYGSEFRNLPLKEKIKDRDLTFCVTFDNRDLNADFAKGDAVSTTLKNVNLGLRGIIGFDTRQAFQALNGEDLKFKVDKNVDLRQGSLTMWICGKNYNHEDKITNGKKRGNIALAEIHFVQGEQFVNYKLYEYGDAVYFDWRSSEPPHGWGTVGRVAAYLNGIKKEQWFQIAVTWSPKQTAIFLNGKKAAENMLPVKVGKTLGLKADNSKSYLGIRSEFYNDVKLWQNAVDDVKIYSRPLTDLEIKNNYLKLLKTEKALQIENFSLELNGVDEGNSKLDRMEIIFDFTALNEKQKKQLKSGQCLLNYQLCGPDKFNKTGAWKVKNIIENRILSGIKKSGKYTFSANLKFPDGKIEKVTKTINVPDLSYANNGIGEEDIVPKPWTPMEISKDRTVKIWNRIYKFGAGPFPEKILVKGQPLFVSPPEIEIETANGKAGIKYEKTGMKLGKSWVEFSGKGQASDFSLNYTTRVEFDGFIKTDFTINNRPVINSMKLRWQVKPKFSKYLMTPVLRRNRSGEFSFPFPKISSNESVTELWLVSKEGGFCWSTPNDGNWRYGDNEKVLKANTKTGKCEVDMISQKTQLPEAVPYQALFIATPTRPLPEKNRLLRIHDNSRPEPTKLLCYSGEGFDGVGTYCPSEGFERYMRRKAPGSVAVYGFADALTTASPVAVYFNKYWNVPGAYIYNFTYKQIKKDGKVNQIKCFTASACNKTSFNDYIINNIQKLFNNKYGDRVSMIYYDLCGNRLCANRHHHCLFKDKFGREIKTFSILNKRELIKRTVKLCHRNNRLVWLHAQRSFFPMLSGLGDYWYPGEQHGGMLRRNPYGYTDELPDVLYRTEYNRRILGTGVLFSPALGYAKMEYFKKPEYTEAMMCMLLANDIESVKLWAAGKVMYKIWNALEKYDFASPEVKCHLYYEQSRIKSSNPNVHVTWYECPNAHYVLMLTNKDLRSHDSTIDLNALKKGNYIVREEYTDQDIQTRNGCFKITVPARGFRIVAFPPESIKTNDDFSYRKWSSWQSSNSKGEFLHNKKQGHKAGGCTEIRTEQSNPKKSSFCFLKRVPAAPGDNCIVKIWVKVLKSEPDSVFSLGIQAQDEKRHFLGLPPKSVKIKGADTHGKWQELTLQYTIPQKGKWAKTKFLLCTVGMSNTGNGRVFFDDFSFDKN